MIKNIAKLLYRKLFLKSALGINIEKEVDCIKIGTKYGGWNIPKEILNNDLVCYLAGAGEDISFDVELANNYSAKVYIFDPTPRAKTHFEKVITSAQDSTYLIDNVEYQLNKSNIDKLTYIYKGLWNKKETLKFYVPKNKDHVSHSALNIQNTEDYFEADVDNISNFMYEYDHDTIDILKIDIEGSEYNVIDDIYNSRPVIKVICVEFDEVFNAIDKNYINRIKDSINKLNSIGYKIIHIDEQINITFIKD